MIRAIILGTCLGAMAGFFPAFFLSAISVVSGGVSLPGWVIASFAIVGMVCGIGVMIFSWRRFGNDMFDIIG